MIVSTTDVSNIATLTLTPTSDLQDPSIITNGDYSQVYNDALQGSLKILFEFDTPQKIGYIALSGNFSTKDRITIKSSDSSEPIYLQSSDGFNMYSSDSFRMRALHDNTIDDSILQHNESRVMMYKVDIGDSRFVEIEIFGSGSIIISQIAMGDYYTIPNGGEQSGYTYPWSVPNKRSRTGTSLNSSPVAMVYESRPIQTTLSVPTNIKRDYTKWYEFIDFAVNNTFYVLDDTDKFHAYAGFNAEPAMAGAHAQTRELVTSSIKFNAYAKSSGIFL